MSPLQDSLSLPRKYGDAQSLTSEGSHKTTFAKGLARGGLGVLSEPLAPP